MTGLLWLGCIVSWAAFAVSTVEFALTTRQGTDPTWWLVGMLAFLALLVRLTCTAAGMPEEGGDHSEHAVHAAHRA